MSQPLLEVRLSGDIIVAVLLPATVGIPHVGSISQQLSALVDVVGCHDVHLDLGNVHCLDSLSLGKLVALQKKLNAAGRRLRLYNVRGPVREALAVTKLVTFFHIEAGADSLPDTLPSGTTG